MSSKVFYPICKECNNISNFELEPLNFSIKYICESDKNHSKKDIYFKTFERFYLREKEIIKCLKCNANLENSEYYICEACKNIYCNKCLIEDITINEHNNSIKALSNNRCLIHKSDYTKYCCTCNENICYFCVKNENIHEGHLIKCYYELMPSIEDIKNLKNKFLEKSKFTNDLIIKLENWKRRINFKVEELKQNLKDEISLLEKIIMNFNNSSMNYNYFNIFNYINENVDIKSNNKKLIEFYENEKLEEQTQILTEVFKYLGKHIKEKDEEETLKSEGKNILLNLKINFDFIYKLNYNLFFGHENGGKIYIFYYNALKENVFQRDLILYNEKVFSFFKKK